MSFNTFCNICFIKENIIKLCFEENEPILKTLISFTPCPDTVTGVIYLCINCCNKLEEYSQFRELFLTNFVRFRFLYHEHKKKLEIINAPDIETQLKAFVDVNVERASGTPLIENYEVSQALRNTTTCNVDITYKESECELVKVELEKLIEKDESMYTHTSFHSEYTTSDNEKHIFHVKYEQDAFKEDQENIRSSMCIKGEPSSFDEVSYEFVATSLPCASPEYKKNCILSSDEKIFKEEDLILEEDEPNLDRFDESQDQLVSDGTVTNVIPCRESADDPSDISFNPEGCVTDDTTDEEGATDEANKGIQIDTVCNECNKKFKSNIELKKHIRTHTGKKPKHCDECGKTFTSTSYLKLHKRIHSGDKPYKCDECGVRFVQRSQLNAHKSTHTSERPYSCDKCPKTFKQNSSLIIHKRAHSGEKPYKCDECDMSFPQHFQLSSHKRKHTSDKPYECDECHKLFKHRFYLISHKRIHSGEKPYKCDECGMRFVQRSQLNTHKSTHTSERPYSCDECQKTFKDNSCLKVHKRIHSGEKPYKCDECDMSFPQHSQLKSHKIKHMGDKPYKCDECHTSFQYSYHLINHQRVHRSEKP